MEESNKDIKVCFSSGKDDWATPQKLYDDLDREFHFTLDACASNKNNKCEKYYTIEQNGLQQDWQGETVFCNPPYSRGTKERPGQDTWIKKAYNESQKPGTKVVMLIPARTDKRAFHKYIYNQPGVEVRFLKGRLRFVGALHGAPFPSMVVVFHGKDLPQICGADLGAG